MRIFIGALTVLALSFQAMAGEIAQAKSAGPGRALKRSLVNNFVVSLENVIKSEVDEYNKNREAGTLVKKAALELDPLDAQYLLSLVQQTLPKIVWRKNKYRALLHGVEISFGVSDILRGQILIAGRPFVIDGNKSLMEIQSDLEAFMLAKKIGQNGVSDHWLMRMVSSIFAVPSAEAAIPLLVIAIILLIGVIGVSFWLKSKSAKLKAVKEALRKAQEDITAKAVACEQNDSDENYDSTFDLMSGILTKNNEDSAAGAFYSTMLQPTAESDQPTQDCRTIVNGFIERTLGSSTSTAGSGTEIEEMRTRLCGGTPNQMLMLGDEAPRLGSYQRLKNCLTAFHRVHRSITDQNRGSVWIDGDIGLVRNRSYYNNSVGR